MKEIPVKILEEMSVEILEGTLGRILNFCDFFFVPGKNFWENPGKFLAEVSETLSEEYSMGISHENFGSMLERIPGKIRKKIC